MKNKFSMALTLAVILAMLMKALALVKSGEILFGCGREGGGRLGLIGFEIERMRCFGLC